MDGLKGYLEGSFGANRPAYSKDDGDEAEKGAETAGNEHQMQAKMKLSLADGNLGQLWYAQPQSQANIQSQNARSPNCQAENMGNNNEFT